MTKSSDETNTLHSNVTTVLRKHYKWLLGMVGVPGIGDLVREYLRGKAMEYVVSKLGRFGDFLVANPMALTSIGVVLALIVLTIMVASESSKETPSLIYEHRDKPFTRPPAPRRWIIGFTLTMAVIIAVISFGTYKYWVHTSRRTDPRFSANTNSKPPDIPVQPIVQSTPDAPTEADRSKDKPHATSGDNHIKTHQQIAKVNMTEQSPSASASSKPTETTPENQEVQPTGAPPGIIPQDPVKAVEVVDRMRRSLTAIIGKKDTITFLITWPKDDNSNLAFVSNLISQACRESPRQCWFTQEGNPQDLDKPPVRASGRPGITVHGPDAYALATALGAWFITHSTSNFPAELNGYNENKTKEIIWIEIGPGSPWKTANH